MLSISSPVFEAMFYGELAETGDSIELPDCEYESLFELFRYMYSDEVSLSDTEEAVKSDGFVTIERSLLEPVVVRDTLTIEEKELFKAVDLWATKECERQGLAADGAVKRSVLGEDVIKGIRFPTMKQEDFASVVLDSKILTPNEIVNIIKYFNSVSTSPVGFPETKRSINSGNNILRCCRFGSVSNQAWGYGDRRDAINFSVDKDIVLYGVCFFGNQENKPFSVDLEVVDVHGKNVLMSNSGRFSSALLWAKKSSYYGCEFLLEKKIILNKNTTYGIKPGSHMIVPIVSVASVASKSLLDPIISDFANDRSDRDDRGDHMRTSLKSSHFRLSCVTWSKLCQVCSMFRCNIHIYGQRVRM
ncbi:hypothetical protein ACROYT_G008751 [Oculina patagonica]